MADFPDEAPPSTRRTTVPFPPFVAPKAGAGASRRTPRQVGVQRSGRGAPARLYTPPGAATPHPRPVAPFNVPDAATPASSEAHEPVLPAGAPVVPDYTAPQPAATPPMSAAPPANAPASPEVEPSEDHASPPWADEDVAYAPAEPEAQNERQHDVGEAEQVDDDWFAEDESESRAMTAEPARPTPAFSDLSGIEQLAPAAAPDETRNTPAPATRVPHIHAVDPPASTDAAAVSSVSFEHDSRADVAAALERVALRVRDGDVVLPTDLPTSSEAAALAAVLAALLRSPSR